MKNKFFNFLIIIFFCCKVTNAEIYNFEVSKIDIKNNGNIVKSLYGKINSEKKM